MSKLHSRLPSREKIADTETRARPKRLPLDSFTLCRFPPVHDFRKIRRLVSTIADLSPAKISVSRIALTKSFLSSNDFSLSSNFLLTASARYSASILDDSAASIASLLQIRPFSSLTFMSAANLLSIKFSYIPFSSFIALYLIHLQSTFFFKNLTPPPTFARRRQSG